MYKKTLVDMRYGGVNMFIGNIMKERMTSLGITENELVEKSFVDEDIVNGLLSNAICVSEVDIDDIDFISQVLYCTPEYFTERDVRDKDVLSSCLNRGCVSIKSNNVKVKIQSIMEDFEFMNSIYEEIESGV